MKKILATIFLSAFALTTVDAKPPAEKPDAPPAQHAEKKPEKSKHKKPEAPKTEEKK